MQASDSKPPDSFATTIETFGCARCSRETSWLMVKRCRQRYRLLSWGEETPFVPRRTAESITDTCLIADPARQLPNQATSNIGWGWLAVGAKGAGTVAVCRINQPPPHLLCLNSGPASLGSVEPQIYRSRVSAWI